MTWTLTSASLEGLLSALDPDRERAAAAYERLRERIAGLLKWWGAADFEELADETLDRVARKLEEGAAIQPGSFGAYVRGVARMVYYEANRRPRPPSRDVPLVAPAAAADEPDIYARFDVCLALLDAGDRELVLRYYEDGKAAEVRSRLASQLGLSPAALRIRAHRIRERLERMMGACVVPS